MWIADLAYVNGGARILWGRTTQGSSHHRGRKARSMKSQEQDAVLGEGQLIYFLPAMGLGNA